MRQRKFGFTLAEVMIVLSVIGILSAVLMPIAFKSSPDKNIMKFKKAHNALHTVVRELVSSGDYFMPGDMAFRADGTHDGDSATHPYYSTLCPSLADLISHKEEHCTESAATSCTASTPLILSGAYRAYIEHGMDSFKQFIDKRCDSQFNTDDSGYIRATDDVYYYILRAACGFGIIEEFMYTFSATYPDGTAVDNGKDRYGFDAMHFIVCIDIDEPGSNKGIRSFGYGVRRDGQIISGARADWWLERDITKKETDCCPKTLNDNGLCDEGDTVCTE